MLKVHENERLTRVGPGTPMGELMRRYWQPIAAAVELDDNPVKHVKILGESLMLYRDRQGRLGLIGDTCPHRRTSMVYGVPEEDGLRCPYHGWLFNRTGQCVEMPASEQDPEWRIGHPVLFPNILRVGSNFQYRVPVDDTHTLHVWFTAYPQPPGAYVPKQEKIPFYKVPLPADGSGQAERRNR
jgi:nitrite reductase/ring-hydroxylating ferredoxin subunit